MRDGCFAVAGTDRRVAFAEVARAAYMPHNFPLETIEPGLQRRRSTIRPASRSATAPTCASSRSIRRPAGSSSSATRAVDDIGTVINPMIVEGQIHGGVAQGIGQALLERCAYDGAASSCRGSFMDYAMPRADDLPLIVAECDESQPCTHNPLGAKGCGESGTIGRPPQW